MIDILHSFNNVVNREWQRVISRPIYLFSSVFVMGFCYLFFLTFFAQGLPKQLPIGLVDGDHTYFSRTLARLLNASSQVEISQQFASFGEARDAMQRGEIYAIVHIAPDFQASLLSNRQPKLTYYVNDAFLVAGSLSYKDLTYISKLGTAYIQQRMLHAKGVVGDAVVKPILQPIAIDTHLIGNPYINYGVYLLNVLLPGILQLVVLMLTIFTVGMELKERTTQQWLDSANGSFFVALAGKMLPYTVLFSLLGILGDWVLFRYMHYPMNGSLWTMFVATVLFVVAYQCIGLFILGIFLDMRVATSGGALYGMLAFSFAGASFPIEGMPAGVQIFSNFFPLRYYFKIYVNEALNGVPIHYSFIYFSALITFFLLPVFIYNRLEKYITNSTNLI